MITSIINLLLIEDFYGVSKNIDIAKGRYKIAYNWKNGKEQLKRIWYGR
jgi:hypothetical protein